MKCEGYFNTMKYGNDYKSRFKSAIGSLCQYGKQELRGSREKEGKGQNGKSISETDNEKRKDLAGNGYAGEGEEGDLELNDAT